MNKKRIISLAMALVLVFSLAAPGAMAEETEETEEPRQLAISTAQELMELSAACAVDSYSKNLVVTLKNDIDLSGLEFFPIPSFSGTFDGAGHKITNMKTAPNGSHQGFFRYVEPEGWVKNLRVEGTVTPEGSRNQLGGIAGVNYGWIEKCEFDGWVKGLNHIGGIAGENYGVIKACTTEGNIEGKKATGGTAGKNQGRITGCKNEAKINTTITVEKVELDKISLGDITNLDFTSADDEDVVSDTGGIAGYSVGIVNSCENNGTVGYRHYGYNVGGIVGRQSGHVNGCSNYGHVYGKKDVAGIVGQMEPFMILSETANLTGEINALNNMVAGTMGNVGEISDRFNSAMDNMPGVTIDNDGVIIDSGSNQIIIGNDGIQLEGDIVGSDTGIHGQNSNIPQWIPDYGQTIMGSIGDSTTIMASGLVGMGNQLVRVLSMLASMLSGEDRTVIEDISEDMDEDDVDGRVRSCKNYGQIEADKNVGGIAGSMGIEYEFDLEGTLSEYLNMGNIISATCLTKCVSNGNVNMGTVQGKKDNIGGICGKEELGTIIGCEGYGGVKSTDGGCVGGIVGYSESSVRGSYAMCNLDGNSNIGGIAGYGTHISGCGSLVGIENLTAPCCGAIAGWADIKIAGSISDNVYVHEAVGAVDGISYAGQAQGLKYGEFLQREGLPEQFKKLKLSFVSEGKLVEELEFTYGSGIDQSKIPQVPEKEGYTGAWPDYSYDELYFSDTIEAVYTPRQATIASRELRGDGPMSVILVEGDFADEAWLNLSDYSGEGPDIKEGKVLEKWVVKVETTDEESLGQYTIRFAPPQVEGKAEIYVFDGENWKAVSTGLNGSYLTFNAGGESTVFAAVETEEESSSAVLVAVAAALLIVLILAFSIRKLRKKKKAKIEAPEENSSEASEDKDTGENTDKNAENREAEAENKPDTEEKDE